MLDKDSGQENEIRGQTTSLSWLKTGIHLKYQKKTDFGNFLTIMLETISVIWVDIERIVLKNQTEFVFLDPRELMGLKGLSIKEIKSLGLNEIKDLLGIQDLEKRMWTYSVDPRTRKYIKPKYDKNESYSEELYSDLWVSPDMSVGEKIKISLGYPTMVFSVVGSEKVESKVGLIDCWILEAERDSTVVNHEGSGLQYLFAWYDRKNGIKIKMEALLSGKGRRSKEMEELVSIEGFDLSESI